MSKLKLVLILMLSCVLTGLYASGAETEVNINENEKGENELLYMNASQYGITYPETFILMQNRNGLRVEYCVDRSDLQLWISPQAWTSLDYRDRNFSNRDDHCKVYDRITLPGLNLDRFERCDFDPFHSILYFKNQTLHLVSLFDEPGLVLWFEQDGKVDLASHKSDSALARTENQFVLQHTDRGRVLNFAAVMGDGAGQFRHQLTLDKGRSIYARAELAAGQPLVIMGELKKERVAETAAEIASTDMKALIRVNEQKVSEALKTGRFQLKDRPEMQKLLEKNRRIALSMQDGGFMRSTNQYIYYLLWYRDGGMNTSHICYSGWADAAAEHCKIALLNPNISREEPKGRFFGQLMAGPITKWEEDGLFYAVWPAFAHWTQTGEDRYVSGQYLKNLQQGMDWLERYSFDEDRGLFYRYYYCETPLTGSRGDGYDNAVGRPNDFWQSTYKDSLIVRSYDLYINMLNYSNYMMLSAMTDAETAETYLRKAEGLEENMRHFFDTPGDLPSYGDLLTDNGTMMAADPYGMDQTDYRWALAIPPLHPNYPEHYKNARNALLADMEDNPKGMFICAYNAILTSMDTELYDEDRIMAALDYLVPQSVRPGKYLPMPYTIPELVDQEDGDPFHDVRPLVYSIAPWLSAVTHMGLHRLPFGIAVRRTKYLDSLTDYVYQNGLFDVTYSGSGPIAEVLLNGEPLQHTLQIPLKQIENGDNTLAVNMRERSELKNCLVSSTVELESVDARSDISYTIRARGQNVLRFKHLDRGVRITDARGNKVKYSIQRLDNLTIVDFDGRGIYTQ
ncbi:MAG: hypothetical protein U5R06_21565 [candidate division KSB1 bacterium]|nr:hypothetical protein [candidate division KSB1 bacterium]